MCARRLVASVASVALLAALGGCATSAGRATPRPAGGAGARATGSVLRLDNWSLDRLDVYVIEEGREWFLGRVEPGASTRLPLPRNVRLDGQAMVRLAVLANAPRRGRPSQEPGVVLTVRHPAARLLAQDWYFAQGQLMGAAGRPPR